MHSITRKKFNVVVFFLLNFCTVFQSRPGSKYTPLFPVRRHIKWAEIVRLYHTTSSYKLEILLNFKCSGCDFNRTNLIFNISCRVPNLSDNMWDGQGQIENAERVNSISRISVVQTIAFLFKILLLQNGV